MAGVSKWELNSTNLKLQPGSRKSPRNYISQHTRLLPNKVMPLQPADCCLKFRALSNSSAEMLECGERALNAGGMLHEAYRCPKS